MPTYTVQVFTYPCQHCGKLLKKARTTYRCERCGKYLCRKHEKMGLCPSCHKTTDVWVLEAIKKAIQRNRIKFWGILLGLAAVCSTFLVLGLNGTINTTGAGAYLAIPIILFPFTLPVICLFRAVAKGARTAKLVRKALSEMDDLPFVDFFQVSLGTGFVASNIEVNRQILPAISKKVRTIIQQYGIQQLVTSITIYMKLLGYWDDNLIQGKIIELFSLSGVDMTSTN